jgi:glycosyltransferase involved in cell wall biosynthesis
MASPELSVAVTTPHARAYSIAPARIREILPRGARYLPYRWIRSLAESGIEAAFLSHATRTEAPPHGAYIWPDCTLNTITELQRAGVTVFREMVNCHRGAAKLILDDAYERLGLAPSHGIDDESVDAEQQLLETVDRVFCPNSCVEASLLQNGLGKEKLLPASYGWDPKRFSGTNKLLPPDPGITVVFVGSICVRKGVHLLLDYWEKSKVRGRLVLAGEMEPAIRERCASLLAREDVIILDYISEVGALYRSADLFAFPSLEEGGPQVTYEAAGCGLPAITTPMGAGRMTRHSREGYVLDPFDQAGWVAALQTLAENADQRRQMAAAARARAEFFHWDAVAVRRKRQILNCLFGNSHKATDSGPSFDEIACGLDDLEMSPLPC